MSYVALYRKFRPQTFEDVKGQDAIVTTFKNQIKANRIGHAYLFSGTRGTGKTTVAKIVAKAVNCEHPVDGSPCGECPSCKAIASGASMNVIEIDAASNNGVGDIRQIREEVTYAPTDGRYKVYIIDEVHMLSKGAYNALLKTLEEPPAYVIFILATTEEQTIPITILSRCQRYNFKRISAETIQNRMAELLKAENVEAEDKALSYIAKAADGSMRDALSLLDQCIAFYYGEPLTYAHVLEVLGAVDNTVFSKLLQGIMSQDVRQVISVFDEIVNEGREINQFVAEFTWYLRNLLVVKTTDQAEDLLEMSEDNIVVLKQEAEHMEYEQLLRFIRILSELSNELRYSTAKRIITETALIKLCRPQMEQDTDGLLERIAELEKRLDRGDFAVPYDPMIAKPVQEEVEDQTRVKAKDILPSALSEDVVLLQQNWAAISAELPAVMKSFLVGADMNYQDTEKIHLFVKGKMSIQYFSRPDNVQMMEEILSEKCGKQIHVKVEPKNQQGNVPVVNIDDIMATKINMEVVEEEE